MTFRLCLYMFVLVLMTSCKSTTTCESLGLKTESALLSVEKRNDDTREVVRYKCVPKATWSPK
jgi:hypothetical protein